MKTDEIHEHIIIGSGPSGLLLAERLASSALPLLLVEKEANLGRKLFIAGSSGLNISYHDDDLVSFYPAHQMIFFQELFSKAPVERWLNYLRDDLGLEYFLGTSRRYFLRSMKAVALMRVWRQRLRDAGVSIRTHLEFRSFYIREDQLIEVRFDGGESLLTRKLILALGGGSYSTSPAIWTEELRNLGILVHEFQPSNAGFEVAWHKDFLNRHDGKPLKNIELSTARGSQRGDCVITSYGLEGTPVYRVGETGPAWIDLKPDLSLEQLRTKLEGARENLSPMRRIAKTLALGEMVEDLIYFHGGECRSIEDIATMIKRFPITLQQSRTLGESISSRGGIDLGEVDANFMLKKYPGVFCIGEMLDWDAPTGGFLIQACASMAFVLRDYLVQD